MTDRELLELAAKAAGYAYADDHIWNDSEAEYVRWNPLTDEGDALRLAVNLRIEIAFNTDCVVVWYENNTLFELCRNDPLAATRRAIVRAAAEIGREK